jgi:hypothetical protein
VTNRRDKEVLGVYISYYFFHPTCDRFLANCDNLAVGRQYTGLDLIG